MIHKNQVELGEQPSAPDSPILSISRLEVSRKPSVFISGFSLEVDREAIAILGSNGVGKTTLLQVLVGLRKPADGTIEFVNSAVSGGEQFASIAKQKIGYVPQIDEPLPGLSVFESVLYSGWLKGLSGHQLTKATEAAIELARCSDFKTRKASRLSGGQFRRLSIAQGLVNSPDILVLDEPTASLDPLEQDYLKRLLVEIKSRTAVIFTTHNLRDLPGLADRVVFINDGRASVFASLADFCGIDDATFEPNEAELQAAYNKALAEC